MQKTQDSNPAMTGSNRTLLIGAGAAIALIVGVTVWNARERADGPARATNPAGGETIPDPQAPAPANAEPAYADIWAGRAPPSPRRQADGSRSLLTGTPEQREEAKKAYEQLGRDLEKAHVSQPVDAAWKGAAETSMRNIQEGDALKSTGFTPQDFRSDCRSRSCRISATFDTAVDAQDWATMFTTMTGSDFRSARYVTVPTADGKTEIRIYGNRR